MSNFSDFIGGGGGSASFPTIFLSKSQTFVPPQDGNVMIHVIGAGGSGSSGTAQAQTSGAAGGYSRKNSLAVTTSGSFTVVVGAGGAMVSDANGVAGGNSTVAGTGLSATLTANGGARGVKGSTSATSGGTAANGNVNNTGGAGGQWKGGGAVGLTSTGNAGIALVSEISNLGGSCDILGDLWSSTLGQIAGGRGGTGNYALNNLTWPNAQQAGPLAGGGTTHTASGSYNTTLYAGSASIGGGGGACTNTAYGPYAVSGSGGAGLVIVQYIP